MPKAKKITVTQPEDWVLRWQAEAWRQGMDLAQWIGECCNAKLSPEVRAKLSERVGRGRPKQPVDDDLV